MKGAKIFCICIGLLFLIPLNIVLADNPINVVGGKDPREAMYYVDDYLDQNQSQANNGYRIYGDFCAAQSFITGKDVVTRVQLLMSKTEKKNVFNIFDELREKRGNIFVDFFFQILLKIKNNLYPPTKFKNINSLEQLGDITLSIRKTLEGTDLTSLSLSSTEIENNTQTSWIEFDIPNISVERGEMYYLVVCARGGNYRNFYTWRYQDNDIYYDGKGHISNDKQETWTTSEDWDFAFKTYGIAPGEDPDGIINRWGILLYDPMAFEIASDCCIYYKEVLQNTSDWEAENIWIYNSYLGDEELQDRFLGLGEVEDKDDIVLFIYVGHNTNINLSFIDNCLEGYDTDNLAIIIDSCRSGVSGNIFKESGREILASSTEHQSSKYINKKSVFSSFVCDGLMEPLVDMDDDGWISTREVFDYAAPRTYDYVKSKMDAEQNPQFFDYIPEYDIPLISTA